MTHVALVGATASGKSAAAFALARERDDIELVSVDSMQVYRGMDIGTAKPTAAERAAVPHHLLDVADPSDEFTVAMFKTAVADVLADIEARGRRALLVGGTALYLRAVVDDLDLPGQFPAARAALETEDTAVLHARLAGLDPVAAARMEPTNRRRVLRALEVTIGSGQPFSSFGPGLDRYPATPFRLVGLRVPREQLDVRIAARFREQMEVGFLAEVAGLRAEHPNGLSRTAAQALGYRELLTHLDGELTLDEAVELAITRTRQFARRQERWFRRDPRLEWIDAGDGHNVLALLHDLLGD